MLAIAAIAFAALAVRTPLAGAYPAAALLLFLWIAADALTLSLVARSPRRRPPAHAVIAALAGACLIVALAAPRALRPTLVAMPGLVATMAAVVALHLGGGAVRAWRVARAGEAHGRARWIAAAGQIVPLAVVRLAAGELALLHLALLRWGGAADVPAHHRAFAYHRHLTPMCVTLLVLQLVEMTVLHLLVAHWSRTAALALLAVSGAGLISLIALVKSFRLRPVLIGPDGVRVRAGLLIDRLIPFDAIAAIEPQVTRDVVRAPATLNAALLAWPNVVLRIDPPLPRPAGLRRRPPVDRVALRLDDADAFLRLLKWRLGRGD